MSTTRERLDAYLACEQRILRGGQTVRAPDGRNVGMAELEQVRAQIDRLQRQLAAERRGGAVSVSYSVFGGDDECRRGFRR